MANFYRGKLRLKNGRYYYRFELRRQGKYKYLCNYTSGKTLCAKLKEVCLRNSVTCIKCPLLCNQRAFAIHNEPKALKRCANCLERFDCYTGNYK